MDRAIARKVRVSTNLEDVSVIVGPKYSGGGTQDPGVRDKFLEFGTRKMAPRFWMRRAFESSKDAAYNAAVTVLKGVLDKLPQGE
jgi:HK97 gp10 family phage protein